MLELYNNLSGTKEQFVPLTPPRVRMYNCGPTVYQYAHIGNLRSFVFADTVRRALVANDYEVDQVINITDVGHLTNDDGDSGEDKLEAAAQATKKTAEEIATFYTEAFLADLGRLGVNTDQITFPRATAHVAQQIELIKKLEENGVTYTTEDGVYFDTSTLDTYPQLGSVDVSGIQAGARVEQVAGKRSPTDFALWKFSQPSDNRMQEWDSPWGRGFPGWHIECSAMAMEYLGPSIDIHTGGIDLQFPHHANEIAQSECASGQQFARYWLHSEHVSIKGAKMAKSDGNVITLADLIEADIHPLAYRYWLQTAHYRSPVSFDEEVIRGVQTGLGRLADTLAALPEGGTADSQYAESIRSAMNDDLDTPAVIATLWDAVSDDSLDAAAKRATAEYALSLLGVDWTVFQTAAILIEELPDEIAALVRKREQARTEHNFDRADEIRDTLSEKGYTVNDTPNGPSVTRTG